MEKVWILDTTLRDGLQSPVLTLTTSERIQVAELLSELSVDVIDIGYPAISVDEANVVKEIVKAVGDRSKVTVLSKPEKREIDIAKESIANAKAGRIHLFVPVSRIHLTVLEVVRNIDLLGGMIEYAKEGGFEVELTLEDALRADEDFMEKVVDVALDFRVDVINIADTVGIGSPYMVGKVVRKLKGRIGDRSIISIHCHNDLGMAVANSVEAIREGARQVHVTLLGIGTRAGNASLEEVVVALVTLGDLGVKLDVNLKSLARVVKSFSKLAGYPIPPHKPIVGDSVFYHKAEYMRIAVVRERTTYEIIDPEMIGLTPRRIVLSRFSGKPIFKEKLVELGYSLTEEEMDRAYSKFRELAEVKQQIVEDDIEAIVEEVFYERNDKIKLVDYYIEMKADSKPNAKVILEYNGKRFSGSATGDGPIDAVYKAINEALGINVFLVTYNIMSVTSGKEALGEVFLKIRLRGEEFSGRAIGVDIVRSSIDAYLRAINKSDLEM
ncbi:MAG: 2-isopropylmalate synthase [Thermosulfidibacteraceae bacterium]